ncbi:hypothetical protein Salat_0510100 [Sesamum alatum]|uniref:Uncharacterized protein n=1 Tax=Sesamum alatum TaxID=300844 RepID=A0AAE2D0R3_9LAMI|nr:hypothetical protein Salat_0510100 [Sesamum alatum]
MEKDKNPDHHKEEYEVSRGSCDDDLIFRGNMKFGTKLRGRSPNLQVVRIRIRESVDLRGTSIYRLGTKVAKRSSRRSRGNFRRIGGRGRVRTRPEKAKSAFQ